MVFFSSVNSLPLIAVGGMKRVLMFNFYGNYDILALKPFIVNDKIVGGN